MHDQKYTKDIATAITEAVEQMMLNPDDHQIRVCQLPGMELITIRLDRPSTVQPVLNAYEQLANGDN